MYSLAALSLAAVAVAAPLQERQAPFEVTMQAPWNSGAVTEWQIHPSCNSSQQLQLRQGLAEMVELAQHAREHILRWRNQSEIYQRYFGDRPTVEAMGSYDIVVNGDRSGALFRCDDPDRNCANLPTWAGHWRGSNATDETVICDRSYIVRRPLATLCGQGYNVREGSRTLFWGSDLLHRVYHMPAFGQGYIDHYADGYDEIVGNATLNSPDSTHDSDGLQYFALDAYAYDIINPGEGCPGPIGAAAVLSSSAAAATSTAVPASSSAVAATITAASATAASAQTAATTSALPDNCHTHADGAIHCT